MDFLLVPDSHGVLILLLKSRIRIHNTAIDQERFNILRTSKKCF